jgi:biopolymer transport protein ExbD
MSMNVGPKQDGVCADINVTPFADIMIVLLIIFMIATTAVSKDDRYRLPPAANSHDTQKKDLVVRVTRDGRWLVGETLVLDGEMLRMALRAQVGSSEGSAVQLQADEGLDYERVAPVLAAVRASGVEQIVLGTQPGARKP